AASEHAGRFALKGGILMAAYGARRPTRDVDLHAGALPNHEATMLQVIREVARRPLDDGLAIDTETARAEAIRDESAYSGVRVPRPGGLAGARSASRRFSPPGSVLGGRYLPFSPRLAPGVSVSVPSPRKWPASRASSLATRYCSRSEASLSSR